HAHHSRTPSRMTAKARYPLLSLMAAEAMPRVWGARLPGATLGVELAATPADGCRALAAKLKLVAGEPPMAPKSDVAGTSDGAATSFGAAEVELSAADDPPGLVCTWSGVTGCSVRSKPLGCGGLGRPGTGRWGITAAPVPGTRATSTLLSASTPLRSKEIVVPSGLTVPLTARPQSYCGRPLHAPAWAGFHAPLVGQAMTTS